MFGSENDFSYLLPSFRKMYEKGIIACTPEEARKKIPEVLKKEILR